MAKNAGYGLGCQGGDAAGPSEPETFEGGGALTCDHVEVVQTVSYVILARGARDADNRLHASP